MADLTSRPDSWMDYLPGNWQQAINTSPLLNALGRATSRPTPDLTRGIEYDQYGSVSDRNWLLEQARGGPPKMNPLAAEMLDKGGLLANFLGPGVKLPARQPFVAPGARELVPGRYRVPYKDGELSYKMMDDGTANISIYTMPEGRGQGHARNALESILAAADNAKQPLSLEVSPGAVGVDRERLRQWYERSGFQGPDYYMVRQPTAPKPTGIRGYHGSPHDFNAERLVRYPDGRTEYVVGVPDRLPDIPKGAELVRDYPLGRFREDRIGTGEGAQAYGRGVAYIAESEGVAKSYRDDLSGANPYRIAGRDYAKLSPDARRYAEFVAKGGDLGPERERVLASLEEARRLVRPGASDPYGIARREIADAEALLAAIDEIGVGTPVTPATGRMYEVNIKADPGQFLDWDLPLNQQPEGVRKAYADALKTVGHPDPSQIERSAFGSSGQGMENLVSAWVKHDRAKASEVLRDAGIPGIKYLDQQSRAAGQGSRNFVVFDEKLIEILRKYGLLPPVAAGTAAALNQQEPQQ